MIRTSITTFLFFFLSNILYSQDTCLLIPTFLGGDQRNYYGEGSPDNLDVVWKFHLGTGKTVISRKVGTRYWAGAGWTGQPLLIQEGANLYLLQGAYDHHLRKIDARTGKEQWRYKFDDVIKGTGTIYQNPLASNFSERFMIFQGSRLGIGNYLDSKHIPSYRSISYGTGKELWRLDVKWDASYSRDVDASCLVLQDTLYIGLENGLFTLIDPQVYHCSSKDDMWQPRILKELPLYDNIDVVKHRSNVVTESSPAKLGNRIYVASGSGHVYGYNMVTQEIDWDYFIGSDMDGTVVVTDDEKLLVAVEKQYIKGSGGVFKLNPNLPPQESVEWYCATGDTNFAGWEGGVIGSCSVNDLYTYNASLASFTALDGYVYVVDHKSVQGDSNLGPDSISVFSRPEVVFKYKTGPAISTPIFTKDRLIVPTYNGLYLFAYDWRYNFTLLDKFEAEFEATPIVWEDKIYIASRNGYLYCLGSK